MADVIIFEEEGLTIGPSGPGGPSTSIPWNTQTISQFIHLISVWHKPVHGSEPQHSPLQTPSIHIPARHFRCACNEWIKLEVGGANKV